MRRLAVVVVLLLTGCGLPLSNGARPGVAVTDERSRPAGIKVLPPGPQRGATAEDLVRGFLRAQASPEDDHAVARQFLRDPASWDAGAFVVLYQPGSQTVRADPGRPGQVALSLQPTARIEADGSYRLAAGDRPAPVEQFRVAPGAGGELRLTQVPTGLRLQRADLSRSYLPREVFFLGRSTLGEATARLVPDRVFLPVTADPARALVQALLRGASRPLDQAVLSAAPPGTTLRGLTATDAGEVTVDLSGAVRSSSVRDRQRLSAQLVWTLQDFSGVRLLVDGQPLDGGSAVTVQTVADWDEFDPAGVRDDAPLTYVQDRRLRSLDDLLGPGDATSGVVPVDEGAIDLAQAQLAVVTRRAGQDDELRVGGLTGALGAPRLRRPELGSLSWGSGDRGVWVLEAGASPRIWLLPGAGAPAGARPVAVRYPTPPGAGRLTRMEVSRDGARIAMVLGEGPARRLHVGQVEPTADGLVVDEVVPVAPQLLDVTDVAWESGTSLAVLARDASGSGLLTARVAVDGSGAAPLLRQGVEGVPLALAAAPGRRLVVSAAGQGEPPRLFRDDLQVFRRQAPGTAPFYPG